MVAMVGALLVPVAVSLSLPFFAAGLGAMLVFAWMLESTPEVPVSGTSGRFGPPFEALPRAVQERRAPTPGRIINRRHLANGIATVGRLVNRLGPEILRPWSRKRRAPEQWLLADLFQDTASLVGDEFVRAALVNLRRALGVRYILLAEILDHTRVRVRQCRSEDHEIPAFEYDICRSPCEQVIGRKPCCYPAGVKALFPQHPLVQMLDVEGYLGLRLLGCDGRPMGLLALLHDAPLKEPDLAVATCAPVARRISAELERTRIEQDLRHSEGHLREIAFSDQLTGLSNRLLLVNRLEHALERARRCGHAMALLFADIDDFKRVNDSAGHDVGDQVLVDAARRIAGCVRRADTVARFGGDEFVVLLEQCGDVCEARSVSEHILCAFARPFSVTGHSWSLSTSIGVCRYDGSDPEIQASDLLKQADKAMYAAKRGGSGRYRFSSPTQPVRSVNT